MPIVATAVCGYSLAAIAHRCGRFTRWIGLRLKVGLPTLDKTPWPGRDEAIAVEVPAGSIVIFHDHMPHYSSQKPLTALTPCVYFACRGEQRQMV